MRGTSELMADGLRDADASQVLSPHPEMRLIVRKSQESAAPLTRRETRNKDGRVLGWSPRAELADGLARTWAWAFQQVNAGSVGG